MTGYNNQNDEPNEYWCTFGGGVDAGEPLEQAVVREMIEETGITPVVGPLLFVQQYQDSDVESIELFFLIANPEDYLAIDLSKTSHGVVEIAEMAFVDPKEACILPEFLNDVDYTDLTNKPTQF